MNGIWLYLVWKEERLWDSCRLLGLIHMYKLFLSVTVLLNFTHFAVFNIMGLGMNLIMLSHLYF